MTQREKEKADLADVVVQEDLQLIRTGTDRVAQKRPPRLASASPRLGPLWPSSARRQAQSEGPSDPI